MEGPDIGGGGGGVRWDLKSEREYECGLGQVCFRKLRVREMWEILVVE